MKSFFGVCLYFLIGMTLTVLIDNKVRDECGEPLHSDTAILITVGWVGAVPVSILSNYEPTGGICQQDEKREEDNE